MPNRDDKYAVLQADEYQSPEAGSSSDDPQELLDLAADIRARREESYNSTAARRRLWEYHNLLLQGESMLAMNPLDQSVIRMVTETDPRQPRSKDNILRQAQRAFVGKMVRTIPTMAVHPASEDRDDMLSAEVADSFKDYIWRKERMRIKYKRAIEHLPSCGTSVFELAWDPSGGRDVWFCPACEYRTYEEPDEPICPACFAQEQARVQQEQMQAQSLASVGLPSDQPNEEIAYQELKQAKEGDLRVLLHDAEDFYPDPGADEPEDMQWCIFEKIMPVNVVRQMFPQAEIHADGDLYADKWLFAPGGVTGARIEVQELHNHVRLTKCYEAPTGDAPNGRIIYLANDRILEVKDNIPFILLGRNPVYLARGDRNKKTLWGEEMIIHAEPIQRERDNLCSQLRRFRELILNPMYMVDADAGINDDQMLSRIGRIFKIRRGRKMEPVKMGQMPAIVVEENERLKLAILEKFSVSPYDVGQGEGSGRFAAIMDTRSSEAVAPLTLEIDEEWKELHRGIIIMGHHYMDPERVWSIRGKGKVMVRSWKDINLQPGWDIELTQQDSLSKNPVIRRQEAMELLGSGYYMDPYTGVNDWDWFRRDAGLKYDGTGADDQESERVYFSQIPDLWEDFFTKLTSGADPSTMPPPPQQYPWDDARIAVDELMRWMRQHRDAPPMLLYQVFNMWQVYASALMPVAGDPQGMVPPFMQKYMPNMGPTLNSGGQNPGGVGMGSPGKSAGEETQQRIGNADSEGEQLARPGQSHEG